jgi:flagellar hook-length control protein FliK
MTPATAPEFPDALGVQVSLLAQDGVQHAELHLNPAEMGPISVRIAIEGQQAQIDFGADSAQTRQLLEAGLPELASALRDAGLTLSGGGVSQHPQPQQQGGRDAGDSNGSNRDRGGSARINGAGHDTAGALAPLSAAQTRSLARRAAGGIDAYA